eukprot:4546372-Pyramimonas_sp.AAC.1
MASFKKPDGLAKVSAVMPAIPMAESTESEELWARVSGQGFGKHHADQYTMLRVGAVFQDPGFSCVTDPQGPRADDQDKGCVSKGLRGIPQSRRRRNVSPGSEVQHIKKRRSVAAQGPVTHKRRSKLHLVADGRYTPLGSQEWGAWH